MERSITFNVKDNTYTATLPTVGQQIKIEELKAVFTNGRYRFIMNNGTVASEASLNNVDMMATITVLCPKWIEDLNADWKDLSMKDFNELKSAYKEKVQPWFDEFMKSMKGA